MGGGDLNMKKHFHPLTMENLERVWKAEEKKRVEDERIEQLQQELAAERQKEDYEQQAIDTGLKRKTGEKLNWMYDGQQAVDKEAYLLGKKIDKHIEVAKEEEKGLSSGKTIVHKTNLPKASDVLAKIKEDPLFLIKKKQEDNRKKLLANPIKLRKMKALIEEQTSTSRNYQKHKRIKKKRRNRSSSSEEEEEEEEVVPVKYKRDNRHSSPAFSQTSSRQGKRERLRNGSQKDDTTTARHRRSTDKDQHERLRNGSQKDDTTTTRHRRSTDKDQHEREERRQEYRNERDSRDDHREQQQRGSYKKETQERYYNDRTKTSRRHDSSSSSGEDDKLEAQRNAMMNNAKWRQKQRSKNTKNYKTEKETEERDVQAMLKKSGVSDEKVYFVQKMQKESLSATGASVEDRIHRNIHSKQRTNIALNKKFTAR